MSTPELDAKLEEQAQRMLNVVYWRERRGPMTPEVALNEIRAALREAVEAAVAQERDECIATAESCAAVLSDLARGFASDEAGDPRGYYLNMASGARDVFRALESARSRAEEKL